MNASFLKAKLPQVLAFFVASSVWLSNGPAALADEDLLDAVLEAHRQSCMKMESAIGTGTLEIYQKEPDDKEKVLVVKAKVDVQFHKGKYSLRFGYQTKTNRVTRTDGDGKKVTKPVEIKPDAFFVIDDGMSWTEVQFTPRMRPNGCGGEIFDDHFGPTIPWRDLAQLSKTINPEKYLKNLGRDKLTVTDLPSGIRRISGLVKNSTKVRFEVDADPKVDFNIVAERAFNEPNKEPAHSKEIDWKKKDGIWYGEKIVEIAHYHNRDGTPNETYEKVFHYQEFSPNAEVKPAVFTLAATGMPRGTRILDHRKDAPNRILYFDGQDLTPERPR